MDDVERGAGKHGGCVLGAGATGADRVLAFVSILSWVALRPESLRSRTPGLMIRGPGGAPLAALTGPPFKAGVGRFGKAPEGGGCGGGGICFPCSSAGRDGSAGAPAGTEKDVPAEVGLELIEVPHVLPEKPLESDCRGRADLDCIVYSESRTYPLVISSSIRSSSSASLSLGPESMLALLFDVSCKRRFSRCLAMLIAASLSASLTRSLASSTFCLVSEA